jgi:hypothetical protein
MLTKIAAGDRPGAGGARLPLDPYGENRRAWNARRLRNDARRSGVVNRENPPDNADLTATGMPMTQTGKISPAAPRKIAVFGREFHMPQSRPLRIAIGVALCAFSAYARDSCQCSGFWMIPLGILVLSYEFAAVRRFRRRVVVWWERRRQERAARQRVSSCAAFRNDAEGIF